MTTAQFQSGVAGSSLGSNFGGGTGLYPYLKAFFPNGVQAIVGAAPAASQVGIYSAGVLQGGGTVSAGANGYVYLAVAAGTLGASGDKIGASDTASGATAVSGLVYTDAGSVTANILTLPTLSAANLQTTNETTYSALQSDLSATFGSTTLSALNTALATTPLTITATNTGGFTVDQAVSTGSAFTLIANAGGVTLSNPITVGGSILIAADGAFTNAVGASALTAGAGDFYTVYSQSASNVTGALPVDSFNGLAGINWYNDAYNFTTNAFASAVPAGRQPLCLRLCGEPDPDPKRKRHQDL